MQVHLNSLDYEFNYRTSVSKPQEIYTQSVRENDHEGFFLIFSQRCISLILTTQYMSTNAQVKQGNVCLGPYSGPENTRVHAITDGTDTTHTPAYERLYVHLNISDLFIHM